MQERQRQIQDLQNQMHLTSENNLLREKWCIKSSPDACLSNAGKGSANIDKLIGEINALTLALNV